MALYVVGTPIGNLEDMTYRAVRVLGEVKLVVAEDTRAALRLLGHFGIRRPELWSFFAGNEAKRTAEIVTRLHVGEDIALITEAGMPGVSDPGQRLVAAAIEIGAKIVVVPGPSAVLAALVASGMPTDQFLFLGFPPRDDGDRAALLAALRQERATMVFYEAPLRVGRTLADLEEAWGGTRAACLARELTKLHEELIRGSLLELRLRFAETAPRGECTLVIAGASAAEVTAAQEANATPIDEQVRQLVGQGVSAREIAARLAIATGKPKRQLYQLAVALKGSPE